MIKYLIISFLCGQAILSANEQPVSPPTSVAVPGPKQYLIVLHVVPRLHDEKAWTEADHAAVSAHFARLKAASATGQVILAGRTTEALTQTLGLIVFSATDETAARDFMANDPCVVAGVMTAELHPYAVALRAR
jgi:uncharacterized protein YciI